MTCITIILCILSMFLPIFSARKIVPIIMEEFENCADPDEDYKLADFSNYELIAINDYEVFINGSIKLLRDLVSPMPVHIFAERYERGEWCVMYYDTKRSDFCSAMKNPSEIWYDKMKDLKGCPLTAGV